MSEHIPTVEQKVHENTRRMVATIIRMNESYDREIAEIGWLHRRIESLLYTNDMLANELKRMRAKLGLKEGESI